MPKKSKPARRTKPAEPTAAVVHPVPAEPTAVVVEPVPQPAVEPVPAEFMPPIAEPTPVVPSLAPSLPNRFAAVLASNQRGNIQTRRVPTWAGAFAQARRLLDEAQGREWHKGEVVSVRVEPVVD
jgi:hypothetical protein